MFYQKLKKVWRDKGLLCIGLDSDIEKIPASAGVDGMPSVFRQAEFNGNIVAATHCTVGTYKPNLAFYEGVSPHFQATALTQLGVQIRAIHSKDPGTLVIADAKRADIGNTNKGYAQAAFDALDADAVTVNPYFGEEAMKPFLERDDKGVIVLCKTSNKGSAEFQDQRVLVGLDDLAWLLGGDPYDLPEIDSVPWKIRDGGAELQLYQLVALRVAKAWNKNKNCALVVGATYPKELGIVRMLVGDEIPILVPGIGTQGGDLRATLEAGLTKAGDGLIINSSSGIIFKSKGEDYAEAANKEAVRLQTEINMLRRELRPNVA